MKKSVALCLLIVSVACLIGAFAGYHFLTPSEDANDAGKIGIIVTILPQVQFMERVGGSLVKVTALIPPGASPHTYEPTPGLLQEVSQAKLLAKVGSGIEFELSWMDHLVSMNPTMHVVDCSSGVELIETGEEAEEDAEEEAEGEHHHGAYDPHIWLSPMNAKIMVENMYQGLVQIDPENQEYYETNKEAYFTELDALDANISQALTGTEVDKIMVYHPSWAYFCKDYGLTQIPIEAAGKEPTPQGLMSLIDQARADNITVIFASPQFSTTSAETIAAEIGGHVALVSPLEPDYLGNMARAAYAFAQGLK